VYQTGPFTGWVGAESGCGANRTLKAVRLARVQAGFRRQSDGASLGGKGGIRTRKALAGSPAFGADAVTGRLAFPRRMAQDSNLPGALTPASGFRPGTLPSRSAILERSMQDSNLRHLEVLRLSGALL
jgi:hypothetical protein